MIWIKISEYSLEFQNAEVENVKISRLRLSYQGLFSLNCQKRKKTPKKVQSARMVDKDEKL